MARSLILETTFLIDLEREAHREQPGPAFAFLEAEQESTLLLTFTVAGELAAGTSLRGRDRWERFLRPFRILPWSADTCWHYGEIHRHLARNGHLIGANDLWIAASALAAELPLVTRNERHFSRVPGLEVVAFDRG